VSEYNCQVQRYLEVEVNNSKWNYDIVITRPDFVCMTQNQYKATQEEIVLQKLSDPRDDKKRFLRLVVDPRPCPNHDNSAKNVYI
jgi:hypothetical protein